MCLCLCCGHVTFVACKSCLVRILVAALWKLWEIGFEERHEKKGGVFARIDRSEKHTHIHVFLVDVYWDSVSLSLSGYHADDQLIEQLIVKYLWCRVCVEVYVEYVVGVLVCVL